MTWFDAFWYPIEAEMANARVPRLDRMRLRDTLLRAFWLLERNRNV